MIKDNFNDVEKISLLKDKIDNVNLDFIKDKIDIIIKERDSALLESTNLHLKIEEDSKFLKNFNIEIEKVHTEISEMRKNKILHDKRKELEHKKDNLISENKDLRKILSENKKLLEEFEKNKIFIKENEEINKSILEIDFDPHNISISFIGILAIISLIAPPNTLTKEFLKLNNSFESNSKYSSSFSLIIIY
jgi:hypothetical protein